MDEELKPLRAYHKFYPFHGEWDKKEGPGKSMNNGLYVRYRSSATSHSLARVNLLVIE